uniref:Uncharacterized protein n=1 Tax=Arundo donax TaxID=35708 RepID=A0A0A8ZS63_ARUDO
MCFPVIELHHLFKRYASMQLTEQNRTGSKLLQIFKI